jgi:hypothetical protein
VQSAAAAQSATTGGSATVAPELLTRLGEVGRQLEQLGNGVLHQGAPLTIPPIFFQLPIAGIERTQATQFFKFNNQGSGFAANNTVPLVAQKELVLRIYVRANSPFWPHPPSTITGKVSYAGHPDLPPSNGPIGALASSAINRGNANHTLNFRIPAAHCVGTVTFNVTVFDPAQPADASSPWLSSKVTVSFDNVPRVRIHGVLIHYTGRGLDIAAPTGLDLVNTLVYVGKTYPISGFNYTACEVVDFNGDLTVGGGGGCGTGWNQLFNMLWNMRAASGTNDVFVGLLPTGVPTSGVIGCGGGGVAIAYKDGGAVLAQEIGHAFGRAHAPCGNPGGPDPNYPTYNSYPSGSIGEFGFDGATGQVFNPASTFDFMSYCGPTWTSPYTYTGLKNGITAAPAAASPERAGGRPLENDYLYLNYRMYSDGRVELRPSFHVYGPSSMLETGPESPASCDLVGPEGEVLETHRCHFSNPHQDPGAAVLELNEELRWSSDVRQIVFRRYGEVCHTIEVEDQPPELSQPDCSPIRARAGAGAARVERQVAGGRKGRTRCDGLPGPLQPRRR